MQTTTIVHTTDIHSWAHITVQTVYRPARFTSLARSTDLSTVSQLNHMIGMAAYVQVLEANTVCTRTIRVVAAAGTVASVAGPVVAEEVPPQHHSKRCGERRSNGGGHGSNKGGGGFVRDDGGTVTGGGGAAACGAIGFERGVRWGTNG